MTLASRLWAVLVVAAATGACRPETPAAKIRQALSLPTAVASPPLGARVESSWRRRDAIVEKVVFDDYNGRPIPALVSYSDLPRERPLPVILFMPGSPNRKEDLVQPRALLPQWAQAGFFVLTIDRPYHGERSGDPEVAVRSKGLPAVLGEYVHDLIRALDYAQTRSEVDASRLGMVGLSMGGMEALLLAAVDERLSCVVSVGGQLSWEDVFTQDT